VQWWRWHTNFPIIMEKRHRTILLPAVRLDDIHDQKMRG
jgi:hypothetical protein